MFPKSISLAHIDEANCPLKRELWEKWNEIYHLCLVEQDCILKVQLYLLQKLYFRDIH